MATSIGVGVWVSGGRSLCVFKLGERGGEQAGNANKTYRSYPFM